MLADGFAEALALNTKGWENRGIEEPKTEALVRGAREGFTETIGLNTALLRRRIHHPDFVIEEMQIGEKTRTKVCIAYLNGVVNPEVVEEVRKRLGRIKTDAILESGYLEQYIEDAPLSIFPTVANSEETGSVAAKILEAGWRSLLMASDCVNCTGVVCVKLSVTGGLLFPPLLCESDQMDQVSLLFHHDFCAGSLCGPHHFSSGADSYALIDHHGRSQ